MSRPRQRNIFRRKLNLSSLLPHVAGRLQ